MKISLCYLNQILLQTTLHLRTILTILKLFQDNAGNNRDMFGNTIDGPIERQTLIPVNSMTNM